MEFDTASKTDVDPIHWTLNDVAHWLKIKGFDQGVHDKFMEHEITGTELTGLTIHSLKSELEIMPYGTRMKIMTAINELFSESKGKRPFDEGAAPVVVGLDPALPVHDVGESPPRVWSLIRNDDDVFASIHEFKGRVRPVVQKFLEDFRSHSLFNIWMPPGTVDTTTRQFFEGLAIPMIQGAVGKQPSLLLHDLGKSSNVYADELFATGGNRILCNTSGSGKTRLLFEGLCKHWGFYFVAEQDVSRLGASDLQEMINKMSDHSHWVPNVLESDDPKVSMHGNQRIALNLLYGVLVARWLVFQIFIEVAMELHNGSLPDDLKHAWLLFQILPSVRIDSEHVLTAFTTRALQGATTELLGTILNDLGPANVLGSAFDANDDQFYYVLDEAQAAGIQHMGGFVDANGKIAQPVLRQIIRTWHTNTIRWGIPFIVSGTGFSLELFTNVLGSGVVKRKPWTVVHEVGNFLEQATQKRYISRYLPAAFLVSQSGILLQTRMHNWLRGRHRFTAAFLEELLIGSWDTNRPSSPHKLLDAYVLAIADYKMNPRREDFVSNEPKVRKLELQAFAWDKLTQNFPLQHQLKVSLHRFVTRGQYPVFDNDMDDLVEYGLGSFPGDKEVTVAEPLALMSIFCYFKKHNLDLDAENRDVMSVNQGYAFEEALLSSGGARDNG